MTRPQADAVTGDHNATIACDQAVRTLREVAQVDPSKLDHRMRLSAVFGLDKALQDPPFFSVAKVARTFGEESAHAALVQFATDLAKDIKARLCAYEKKRSAPRGGWEDLWRVYGREANYHFEPPPQPEDKLVPPEISWAVDDRFNLHKRVQFKAGKTVSPYRWHPDAWHVVVKAVEACNWENFRRWRKELHNEIEKLNSTTPPAPKLPTSPFDELLAAVEEAGLIGKEAKVVRVIVRFGGRVSIPDAKLHCDGDAVSAYKRAKKKLKKVGWILRQSDNHLLAERLPKQVRK
jgi:hypothetical protein